MSVDPQIFGTDLQIDLEEADLVKSPQGGLATVSYHDNVKQAILRLLDTRQGELILHREWGNTVWDILSEPITRGWVDRVHAAMQSCLALEPRIIAQEITVSMNPERGEITFGISYIEVSDLTEQNLIWTVNYPSVRRSIASSG